MRKPIITALCRPLGEDIAREMVERGRAEDWSKFSGGYYAPEVKP